MKFNIFSYKTPLFYAIQSENNEIAKLLSTNKNIDVNIYNIFKWVFVYKIQLKQFDLISQKNFFDVI